MCFSINWSILLIVDKPQINTAYLNKTLNSWLHHKSILTCEAEGNPSPTVTWSPAHKVNRSHTGISSSASIVVSPKEEEDFGPYTCKAWNKLGTVEFHVEVVRSGIEVCHDFWQFFFFCCKHNVMSSIPVYNIMMCSLSKTQNSAFMQLKNVLELGKLIA